MFGERALNKAIIKVTKESAEQYDLVAREIGKLKDVTGIGWDLISSDLLDKVRRISFVEGGVVVAAGVVTGAAVSKAIEKRKQKKAEQRLKEKGLL